MTKNDVKIIGKECMITADGFEDGGRIVSIGHGGVYVLIHGFRYLRFFDLEEYFVKVLETGDKK
jgi:hypothetical protein